MIAWLTTTDHKTIGTLYLSTSIGFFVVGGILALVMRAELARPGLQIVSNEQFNQAFTMHGTIMLLMFATPLFVGFANWIMPLQIGAPDVAFPRLNMFAYAPLSDAVRSPGVGADMWIMGLAFQGFGTILGSVTIPHRPWHPATNSSDVITPCLEKGSEPHRGKRQGPQPAPGSPPVGRRDRRREAIGQPIRRELALADDLPARRRGACLHLRPHHRLPGVTGADLPPSS